MKFLALLSLTALLPACSPPPEPPKPASSVPKEIIDKAEHAKDQANQAVATHEAEAMPTEQPGQ